jgi:hypothetical protein
MKDDDLQLITAPPTEEEAMMLNLDASIDKCLSSIKEMKKGIDALDNRLEHPFHKEALANMNALIDEALVPYLDQLDKEFKVIVG